MEVGTGNVDLTLHDGYGFQLNAEVQTGVLSVPDFFSASQTLDDGRQRLLADVNGGGKLLKVRANTGTINVTAVE